MRTMRQAVLGVFFTLAFLTASTNHAHAQAREETNVVYGMYSGLALLMDVHHPSESNGHGILIIGGTGWHLPVGYNGIGQKDRRYPPDSEALLAAGYTLFHINHRAAPRFRYPASLEDVQRAVRFIRFHALRFGIDPDRIGAWGFSSGAHLAALLGVLKGTGDPQDPDPVNRVSAKLQCVVAGALPADLTGTLAPFAVAAVASFLGTPQFRAGPLLEDRLTVGLAREASPVHHVSADDAAFLLEHGDADELIPFAQSEAMKKALHAAGVPVLLRRVPGGDHGGPKFAAQDSGVRYRAIIDWFNQFLRDKR
jgi:acetyl esterase/lipase